MGDMLHFSAKSAGSFSKSIDIFGQLCAVPTPQGRHTYFTLLATTFLEEIFDFLNLCAENFCRARQRPGRNSNPLLLQWHLRVYENHGP